MRVKSSKSTADLLAGREVLRAGSTSLRASFTVSLLGDYQCFAWVFVWLFVVGAVFVVLFCHWCSPFFLSLAFDAQGRHSSKTVTIVMMSAAPEQKKNRVGSLTEGQTAWNLYPSKKIDETRLTK